MKPDAPVSSRSLAHFDVGLWLRDWLRAEPLLIVGFGLTVVICHGFLHRWTYLNGPEEWLWTYRREFEPIESLFVSILKLIIPFLIAVLAAAIVFRLAPRRIRTGGLLGVLLLWGMYYQWRSLDLIHLIPPESLIATMISGPATGYNTVASWIGTERLPPLQEFLATYPEHVVKSWPIHAQTHPPGNVLLGYGVQQWLLESPARAEAVKVFFQSLGTNFDSIRQYPEIDKLVGIVTGVLMLMGAVLTALPLFFLVRGNEPGDALRERTAWIAAILWIHSPGAILFIPSYDQFYPMFAMTALWAGWRASVGRPILWGAICGLVTALGIFMTFKIILWIPAAGLMLIGAIARTAGTWRPAGMLRFLREDSVFSKRMVNGVAAATVGFLAYYVLIWLVWRINIPAIFAMAGVNQARLTVEIGRTYFIWLLFGPWDILLFTGTGLVAMVAAMAWKSLLAAAREPRLFNPVRDITVPALILVTISGLVLGENARQLIMFYPNLMWIGAAWLTRPGARRFSWPSLCMVLLLQHSFMSIAANMMRFIDHGLEEWKMGELHPARQLVDALLLQFL